MTTSDVVEPAKSDTPNPVPSQVRASRTRRVLRVLVRRAAELFVLLFVVSTVLFFLLRLTGDPATILAGENANAEILEKVRQAYGLDKSVFTQYGQFLVNTATLDFGISIQSGEPTMGMVLDRLPYTITLAAAAIVVNLSVAVPLGAWLGAKPHRVPGAIANFVLVVGQGVPGYVVGLILIQIFAVNLGILPSIGNTGWSSWIMPVLTLAAFQITRLARVVSTNVASALSADYVRTARALGASRFTVVTRHALPNALLGAAALVGSQFAFLLSGALITEVIFAWPGVGRLLIDSVLRLDFPVVQAAVFLIAVLVFLVNATTDLLFSLLDPRLRRQRV